MQRYNIVYSEDRTRASRFGSGATPTHELDPETGLPKVPEGYYFKVGGSCIRHWLQVHYMKKRTWWFDTSLNRGSIAAGPQDTITSDDILWEALEVMDARVKEQEERKRKAAAGRPPKIPKVKPVDNSKWFGKYPPKTLKEL